MTRFLDRTRRALCVAAGIALSGCSEGGSSSETDLRRALDDALAELAEQCATPLRELARARGELDSVPGRFVLEAPFLYAGETLQLETPYSSAVGQVSVRSLRYWLSNLTLVRADATRVPIPDSYYLMEIRDVPVDKKNRALDAPRMVRRREVVNLENVPAGQYDRIEFDLGVDPAHNDDLSIPGGELNVLNSMAVAGWMWFTSYIFTSVLVYRTPAGGSEEDLSYLVWENGKNEDLRHVELPLEGGLSIGREHHETVRIPMNADVLFSDPASVTGADGVLIDTIDAVRPDGRAALADNWKKAFKSASVRR